MVDSIRHLGQHWFRGWPVACQAPSHHPKPKWILFSNRTNGTCYKLIGSLDIQHKVTIQTLADKISCGPVFCKMLSSIVMASQHQTHPLVSHQKQEENTVQNLGHKIMFFFSLYRWPSARLQQLHCKSTGATAVPHQAIDMYIFSY